MGKVEFPNCNDYGEADYELESRNCTPPAILKFPTLLTDIPPRFDYAAIAFLISVYLFISLAIICDQFLVAAVECLCYKLKMPYNIAGATFLAATTSAPEFFVNMIGTFVTEGDIGIGTIVGSSVFNSLAMPAILGIFSGVNAQLNWWPLTRDVIWYIISTAALTCVIWDNLIYWQEALFLVVLFIIYLISLIFDISVQNLVKNPSFICTSCQSVKVTKIIPYKEEYFVNESESVYDIYKFPYEESLSNKCIWCIFWPIYVLYTFTIYNCHRDSDNFDCIISLIMCMIWISLQTYIVSWMLTVVGFNFFVPDTIMGITFLALGTSIPEAISGLIVTCKGYGSMSICNALSSNTYDILFCLGVPWLFKSLFFPKYAEVNIVYINSEGIFFDSTTLVISVIVFYIAFISTNFTLGTKVGIICGVSYFIYLLFACAIEMNIFGLVNLPTCDLNL